MPRSLLTRSTLDAIMGRRGKRGSKPPKRVRDEMKRKSAEEAIKTLQEENDKKEMPISTGHKHYISKGVQTEDSWIPDAATKARLIGDVDDKENNKIEEVDRNKMDIDDSKGSFDDEEFMSGMEEYTNHYVFKQDNEDESLV